MRGDDGGLGEASGWGVGVAWVWALPSWGVGAYAAGACVGGTPAVLWWLGFVGVAVWDGVAAGEEAEGDLRGGGGAK